MSNALDPLASPPVPTEPPARAARRWTTLFWNADERRVRAGLRIVAQQALLALLVMLIGLLVWIAKLGKPEPALAMPLVALASWVSVMLVGRWLDRRSWREFGLQLDRAWWWDLSFGLVLGALLMTLGFVFEYAVGWLRIERVLDARHRSTLLLGLMRALALFIAVGFYEELLARGYLLRNLAEGLCSQRISAARALASAGVLTALLFGLAHGGNPSATLTSTVNVALAGLLLALPYVLTGRLALSIGFHITWNLFQGPIFGLPVSGNIWRDSLLTVHQQGPDAWTGGAFGPEAGLVGLVLMALGALAMLAWIRWREGALGLHVALCDTPTAPLSDPERS
jgi:hypothetical protein